jgi:hypothetical protein
LAAASLLQTNAAAKDTETAPPGAAKARASVVAKQRVRRSFS